MGPNAGRRTLGSASGIQAVHTKSPVVPGSAGRPGAACRERPVALRPEILPYDATPVARSDRLPVRFELNCSRR